MMATAVPSCIPNISLFPVFVEEAWTFPIGLIALVCPQVRQLQIGEFSGYLLAGWVLYIALTAVGLFQRRRLGYFIVYSILCLLLILNAVGCNVNLAKTEWHT
jgi:hypothetical protein